MVSEISEKKKKYKLYLKTATNRCVNFLLIAVFPDCTNFEAILSQFFYFMGRVLPISNKQEAKTGLRTGTHFSILEVVAAKMQLGKL